MRMFRLLVISVLAIQLCPIDSTRAFNLDGEELDCEILTFFSANIDGSGWVPDQPAAGPSWTALKNRTGRGFAPDSQSPVIMMAGYMDTDISWQDGGTFTMLAWVWDPDDNVVSVEIHYAGEPVGVFLKDDGQSGDFGPDDGLYGITMEISEHQLAPGDYLLELMARDSLDNVSDLWPYLTIHD